MQQAIESVRRGVPSERVFVTDQSEFQKLPYAVFGYWCSPELRDAFVNHPILEGNVGHAAVGLQTSDDARFLRLRWEVAPSEIGDLGWQPFAKGGEYSPFYDDIYLMTLTPTPRSSLAAFEGSYIRNPDCYGKAGITWPPRTNKRFAPRALPRGCAFGHKGPSIVGIEPDPWALLAALNSRVVSYLLSLGLGTAEAEGGAGANSYEVGLVQRIPVPGALPADRELAEYAKRAWGASATSGLRDETSALFLSPVAPLELQGSLEVTWTALIARDQAGLQNYVEAQEAIDQRTCKLYGLTARDWVEIESNIGDVHRPEVAVGDGARRAWARSIASFLVGCAFGRWSTKRLGRSYELTPERAYEAPTATKYETPNAPLLLVDDEGHALDIVARCDAALEEVAPQHAGPIHEELVRLLGADLRRYFQTEFFDAHLRQYSKSRRSAPIYIPLSSPGADFTVWLNAQRATHDTLFTIQSEILAAKLRLEEGRRAAAQSDASTAKGRKALDKQDAALDALRTLVDEVKRVAPLWQPNTADGTVINFAPLWRLVPSQKAWQKELKANWDALCAGDYDWSRMAMHLWPERVVPKCAKDRSLAIAHGLEDVFWVEGSDGKYTARGTPNKSVEDLVTERTSAAVKSALKSLVDAPVASGKSTGRGRGARRKGADAVEGDA